MTSLPPAFQSAIEEFESLLTPAAVKRAFSLTPDAYAPLYADHIRAAYRHITVPGSAVYAEMEGRGVHDQLAMARIFTAVFYAAMYQRRAPLKSSLCKYMDALIRNAAN